MSLGDESLGVNSLGSNEPAPYDISAQEEITSTIPAGALTSGVGLIASPTFTIDAAQAVNLSGSATASITEVDIAAGGKQIILDLTGNTWVAAGTAFDAIRRDILDGLVSDQNEQFGWNNMVSPNEPVTSVVRDSDTRVIITLEAH